jgi:hypothetical protein
MLFSTAFTAGSAAGFIFVVPAISARHKQTTRQKARR